MRRRFLLFVVTPALLTLIFGEFSLRFLVGLGDPPLYQLDPTVEYLMAPGSYKRFGNTVFVNSAHMRSPESSIQRASSNERRVLVIGDSVVNGGSLTDQANLATELMPHIAEQRGWKSPLRVCNVSAGSWGPGNLLAFVRKFGSFGCDDAVIVLNSADLLDVPTFTELGPEQPTVRPSFAIEELFLNYGRRIFRGAAAELPSSDADSARQSLQELLDLLSASGSRCRILFHPTRQELAAGLEQFRGEAAQGDVPWCSSASRFREAQARGEDPYRDDIHPSALGQAALAEAIIDCLEPSR
jgi:hypothetical protein